MHSYVHTIRRKETPLPFRWQAAATIVIGFVGIILGTFSKWLDTIAVNDLPGILEVLDLRNFLGRFPFWILIAILLSRYSRSAVRAAVNVFVFFAGMVASYYLYSYFAAGFFPRSYACIWFGFTILSPFLAWICWSAGGTGRLSFFLSALIFAAFFNMTFVYGWFYFDLRSILELLVFVCSVLTLRRENSKETLLMAVCGIAAALVLNAVIPFHFG